MRKVLAGKGFSTWRRSAISIGVIGPTSGDRGGVVLAEAVELLRRGAKDQAGFIDLFQRLESQTELEEREGMAFGEVVLLADRHGFAQGGGAGIEMTLRARRIELGQAA